METKNQTAQESAQSGVVDYAAALRQYHRYGRGRSMKKFCEDEGYDYWKFCKLAREGQSEMDAKIIADKHPVFIEVNPDGTQSSVQRDEPMKVCEIRIRFNNGLVISRKGVDAEVSNNISEQSVRKLKMNLRNAGNIRIESSAVDNAFMYSVIESCKHNEIDPGKYISYLLGKLKTAHEGEDMTALLPCYYSLQTLKIDNY